MLLVEDSNIQEHAISHVDDSVRRLEGGLAHDLRLQGDELLRDLLKGSSYGSKMTDSAIQESAC